MGTPRVFLCHSCNRTRDRNTEGEMICFRCTDDAERVRAVARLAEKILPALKGRHPSYIFARMLRGVVERVIAETHPLGAEREKFLEQLKELESRELRRGWEYKPLEGERS